MKLPEQMPKFFRKAVDQLGYLNPEPDRWRSRDESNLDKALDSAYAPDHFLDLELVPPAAFTAEDSASADPSGVSLSWFA